MNSSKEHSNYLSSILSQSLEDRGYEDYVLKLSKGKCFFNRRYLILRNGIIAYYQEKPTDYHSISSQPPKPKGKIHILDTEIKKVDSAYARKKNQPYMFQISYILAGKKTKSFWIFSVTSENLLNQWIDAFERSRNPVMAIEEEEEEKENFSESEQGDNVVELKEVREKQLREENFKKALELERQRSEKKKKEIEEAQRKEEAEREQRKKEEDRKRKVIEKAEKKRREKNKKLLESFWDFRFQKLMQEFLQADNSEEVLECGLKIFKLLGIFREAAINAAKIIINDIQLPIGKRKIQKLEDSTFIYKNILIYLSWEKTSSEYSKHLGHEFRANEMLQNAIFFLSKTNSNFRIKIPMSCLVDFKGFRAYVTAIVPLDKQLTVLHGLKDPDYYLTDSSLYSELSNITNILNLKDHSFQWDYGIIPSVHLSIFTQVHESLPYSEIEYLENHVEENSTIYLTRLSEILPVDFDFNSPPSDFSQRIRPEFFGDYQIPLSSDGCINLTQEACEVDDYEICEASLKVKTDKVAEVVDLLDSLTIIPIDSRSLTQALHANGINCRYLGLIMHRTALPHIKDLCLVEIIGRACKRLLFQQLADLVMENAENEQSDLEGTTRLADLSSSIKAIEGNYYVEDSPKVPKLIIDDISLQNTDYRRNAFILRLKKQLNYPSYKDLKEKIKEIHSPRQNLSMEGSLKECIVDYLNLIFGISEESEIFWQEILIKKSASSFHINPDKIDKSQINLHALLHSIAYHCGLQLAFSKETMLGKIENPFSLQSLERIKEKTKALSLQGVESRIIAKRLESDDVEDKELESSLLALEINKALNPDPEYLGDTLILAEIGEILLERKDLEGAIRFAKDALLQIHPLHAEGVKSWCVLIRAMMENSMQDEALQCFDHALTALEYHWGPYHPLHCTLYSILAYLYMSKDNFEEALILYKNSLMCSLRVLGPNHPHTAEVYIELGTLYVRQKSIQDAIISIEKGYFVYEASLGTFAVVTVTAGIKLAQLYIEVGKYDKALPLIKNSVTAHEGNIERLSEDKSNNSKILLHLDKLNEVFQVGLRYAKSGNDSVMLKYFDKKLSGLIEERSKYSV